MKLKACLRLFAILIRTTSADLERGPVCRLLQLEALVWFSACPSSYSLLQTLSAAP